MPSLLTIIIINKGSFYGHYKPHLPRPGNNRQRPQAPRSPADFAAVCPGLFPRHWANHLGAHRISYAYDIRIFFNFLLTENPAFKEKTMSDITVDVLDQIQAVDIEEYQEYLKVYDSAEDNRLQTNGERGLKRKLSGTEKLLYLLL